MQTAIGSGLVSASDYKSAMRRLLGGVCLVTTRVEGLPVGCTATAVTSVSADPPMLLTCLNKGSKTRAAVLAAGVFGISVLKADRIGTARRFAGMEALAPEGRFLPGDWHALSTGVPLLRDAAATFDCRVANSVDIGTHTVVFGMVNAVRSSVGELLAYAEGAFIAVPA